MKVVLDSNILFDSKYSKDLTSVLAKFVEECNKLEVTIVLPTTVIAEADRKQRTLKDDAIKEINKSIVSLRKYQIPIEDVDIESVLIEVGIVNKFKKHGALLEIMEPTLDIYNRAHKIASEHLPPCIKKEDEMRDIIIWEIACDVAKSQGGALVVSNDEVFWGDQGNEIAREVNLTRVKTIDDALGVLEVGSPARIKAEGVLNLIWNSLVESILPIDKNAKVKRLYNISFIEADYGLRYTGFHATITNPNGKNLNADFRIDLLESKIDVNIQKITFENKKWDHETYSFSQDREDTIEKDSEYDSKIARLRSLLGG